MGVTIQDAINAFVLLSEHVNENSFLHECYNLGISALKTIQDGGYTLNNEDANYRKNLKRIADFDCTLRHITCDGCQYNIKDGHGCLSMYAYTLFYKEGEVKKWIQENS